MNGKSIGRKKSPDHFFYFDVPNTGKSMLKATAGNCSDESVIQKVEQFNETYRFVDKTAVLNWFDITEVDRYLSLNSKVSEILETSEGAGLFEKLLSSVTEKNPELEGQRDMVKLAGGLTLLRLTGMLGKDAALTKEQLLELNEQLNRIKKPE